MATEQNAEEEPVIKVMLLLKRRPDLTLQEFIERYERDHVPAVEQHATAIRHYERHYLHPSAHVIFGDQVQGPDYDVITELWYDDLDAFNEQQEGLRSRPEVVASVIADEERLFDRSRSRCVIAEDHSSTLGA